MPSLLAKKKKTKKNNNKKPKTKFFVVVVVFRKLEKYKEKKEMDLTWGKEKVGTSQDKGILKNFC